MKTRYAMVCIFNKSMTHMLCIKNKRGPFAGKWNAIGGRIYRTESEEHAAWREVLEETEGVIAPDVKTLRDNKLCTIKYPNNIELCVFYAFLPFVDKVTEGTREVKGGTLRWLSTKYLARLTEPNLAGEGQLAWLINYARNIAIERGEIHANAPEADA